MSAKVMKMKVQERKLDNRKNLKKVLAKKLSKKEAPKGAKKSARVKPDLKIKENVYRSFLRLVLMKFGRTRPLLALLKSKGVELPEYLIQNWKQTGRIPLEHVFRIGRALELDPWVLSFEMMTIAHGTLKSFPEVVRMSNLSLEEKKIILEKFEEGK